MCHRGGERVAGGGITDIERLMVAAMIEMVL
jgi:hypothetical protein